MPKFSYQPKIILFKIKIVTEKNFNRRKLHYEFPQPRQNNFFQLNSASDVLNKNQY